MAFNSYITLDSWLYKTLAKNWRPSIVRPGTSRVTLQGDIEMTFGPTNLIKWEGIISMPHGEANPNGPSPQYGNSYTLFNSLKKADKLRFTDHYNDVYDVFVQGPFEINSLVNVWNSPSNKYFVRLTLLGKFLFHWTGS